MRLRPPTALLMAVALIASATLGLEVSLTRVFAVLLRYHFAFLVISIAVCGLGVGGYVAFWIRRRRTFALASCAALFGASAIIALALMLRGVFALFPDAYWLAALLILIPFSCAGAFLAEVFARFPQWSGRLYAWDLAGAALTALLTVGVLQVVSAIDACVLMAGLATLAGVLVARSDADADARSQSVALGVLMVAVLAFATNAKWRFLDIPPLPPRFDAQNLSLADRGMTQPLFTELATPGHTSKIVETHWSAFARTDVVFDRALPNSYYLYTNGNVPTNMMHWDGKIASIKPIAALFPLSDWAFAVAPFDKTKGHAQSLRPQSGGKENGVLSIGPGGGLDALLALYHGAQFFDGAEINPSIVQLVKGPYARYNGGIYNRPDVNVRVADGRAFVREAVANNRQYALLYSALTKTATAGQGLALLESFIYTSDAFADYFKVLKDDGQVTVVLDNPILTARFFATALQVLELQGISNAAAMDHVAIVHDARPGPYTFAFVVQKSPFSRAQTFGLEDAAIKRGLQPVWIPHQAANRDFGPYPEVATGQLDLSGFMQWFAEPQNTGAALVIAPCPDNRPFVLDLTTGTLPVFKQLTIFALVLALGVLALGWRTANAASEEVLDKSLRSRSDLCYVLYFLALGIGFMLVEIPLAQKLILPLGYPTLALTVILFSILLGGGLGAWFSQRFEGEVLRRWAQGCALMVALTAGAGVLVLPLLDATMLAMEITMRCALATLLLLPLGFALGTPFPSGIRLFATSDNQARVPLIWGLNGVASVVGSLLAAMGAKSFGFSTMLLVGAVIYVIAALLLQLANVRSDSTP